MKRIATFFTTTFTGKDGRAWTKAVTEDGRFTLLEGHYPGATFALFETEDGHLDLYVQQGSN